MMFKVMSFLTVSLLITACGGGGGSNRAPSPPPANMAPDAVAGTDQTVLEGIATQLDGSASSDTDGMINDYAWMQASGPVVTLQNADSATPSFTSPLLDAAADLVFDLVVTDDDGATDTDSVTVSVTPSQAPQVDAGVDQTVVERANVTLSGSSDDVDGSIVSRQWTQVAGPTVIINDSDQDQASFEAPEVSAITDFVFELAATDNTDDGSQDQTTVTVEPNEPPEVSIAFPCDGCRVISDTLRVTGVAQAGADSPFVANLDSVVGVEVLADSGVANATIAPDGTWLTDIGLDSTQLTHQLTVTATDAFGESSTQLLQLTRFPTLTNGYALFDPDTAGVFQVLEIEHARDRLIEFDLNNGSFDILFAAASTENGVGDNLANPMGFAFDSAGDRFIVTDTDANSVVALARDGTSSILSDGLTGTGPDLVQPTGIEIDNLLGRAIVTSNFNGDVTGVDLNSGDRTLLAPSPPFGFGAIFSLDQVNNLGFSFSGSILSRLDLGSGVQTLLNGSGPGIARISRTGFDAAADRVVVSGSGETFVVDSADGTRTLLSAGNSDGINISGANQTIVDSAGDRYVVNILPTDNALVAIDSTDGSRSVLFADQLGTGPIVATGITLAHDGTNQRLLATDTFPARIVSLDLATRVRTSVFDSQSFPGVLRDFAYDEATGRAFAIDIDARVYEVSLDSSNASTLLGFVLGIGNTIGRLDSIVLDLSNNRLLVSEQITNKIAALDISTGEVTTVSDDTNVGPSLDLVLDMYLDVLNNRLIAVDQGDGTSPNTRLVAVDLATGDKTDLLSELVGTGPLFVGVKQVIAVDDTKALVANETTLFEVDLTNGDRRVVADPDTGVGEPFMALGGVTFDAGSSTAYVYDEASTAILMVELESGDRVVVSK